MNFILGNEGFKISKNGKTVDVFDALEALNIATRNAQIESGNFVDLGLPSGTLWASRNLGADEPEDAGLYFMWGDIQGHTASEGFNFEWGKGYDSTTHTFDPTSNYGKCKGVEIFTDIPVNPKYDAAQAMLGGSARIPTRGDFYELMEFTTRTWTTLNGVNGYRLTGRNGKSIFLPAAGQKGDDGSMSHVGESGYYWESTMGSVEHGCLCRFYDSYFTPDDRNVRYYGYTVRPVQ